VSDPLDLDRTETVLMGCQTAWIGNTLFIQPKITA
jgi:hypothetical protein